MHGKRAPRRQRLLPALALALLAAPALHAQPTATIKVVPASPTPQDAIVLQLSGQWSDSCVPGSAVRPSFTRDGNHFLLTLNYANLTGVCASVVSPWSVDVPIGRLAAGTYQADLSLLKSLLPAQNLASTAFTVAPPPTTVVYVPGVLASSAAPSGCDGTLTLKSALSAFNNGGTPATVRALASYDADGAVALNGTPAVLDPGESGSVDTASMRGNNNVQIVALETPGRVALRPTLEKSVRCGTAAAVAQGRLALPVFGALYPAGSTVVSGDVKVVNDDASCSPLYRRRVNLTLFNAGTDTATFTVSATRASGTGQVYQATYSVPPRSVRQWNALPLDATALCGVSGSSSVWFAIGADQPFLSYVSTAFEDAAPGAIPYEVYPSRLEQ